MESLDILSPYSVDLLYRACLVDMTELRMLTNGTGLVDTTTPDSLLEPDKKAMFSTRHLKKNKDSIFTLINQVDGIDGGVHFTALSKNQRGEPWTNQAKDIEKLVLLGIATNCISYCGEKETWSRLPYGLPVVIKSISPQIETQNNSSRIIS